MLPQRVCVLILILGLWTLGFFPCTAKAQTPGTIFQSYSKPMPCPEFSLQDLNGKKWDSAKLRGEVVLLNFWATW